MAYTSADIRNVCLVGPSNGGKTQLAEALLHAGGAIAECGSVDKGDTVSDFTKRERELGHSQYSSVCHFDHEGIHVNLIDTPGYRDFYGRALSVIPAAERPPCGLPAKTRDLRSPTATIPAVAERPCHGALTAKLSDALRLTFPTGSANRFPTMPTAKLSFLLINTKSSA